MDCERQIIEDALGGDADAFEAVMRACGMRVYAVAYAILLDRQEAEDCAQEAFLKIWRARRQARDPDRFSAWLLTVARNTARDRLRRRAVRPQTVSLAPDTVADPVAPEANEDHPSRVHALLARLPEQHRTALTLRYLEGLDHRAIEQTMALSNGALRGILSRALETMRRGLRAAAAANEIA